MHFGNCEGLVHSAVLKQAVTASVLYDRFLGGHKQGKLRNELLLSLSGNAERLTYDEDIAARARLTQLTFSEEDPNARSFSKTDLHAWALDHRAEILSAIAGLVDHWIRAGQPAAPSILTSFPEWRSVVGGIVYAAGLGDACAPDLGEELIGGDEATADMKALFKTGHAKFQESWVPKKEISPSCVRTRTSISLPISARSASDRLKSNSGGSSWLLRDASWVQSDCSSMWKMGGPSAQNIASRSKPLRSKSIMSQRFLASNARRLITIVKPTVPIMTSQTINGAIQAKLDFVSSARTKTFHRDSEWVND